MVDAPVSRYRHSRRSGGVSFSVAGRDRFAQAAERLGAHSGEHRSAGHRGDLGGKSGPIDLPGGAYHRVAVDVHTLRYHIGYRHVTKRISPGTPFMLPDTPI